MTELAQILRPYGKERTLAPGKVLIRQGSSSDGVYLLQSGRLGAYREEADASYFLSEIMPGSLVGEIASTTGWSRTATVKAEEESLVLCISGADFHQALKESADLVSAVVMQIGERLTDADVARVALGRGYRRALDRAETLSTEKAQLEEALRLREELADMIVHDLRNPLAVILGGLQMLGDIAIAEPDRGYAASVFGTMQRSAQRMHRLVDALLDIACLEADAMVLHAEALDVASLVAGVIADQRPLAEKKGMVLESRLPESLRVLADRDILQRVLVNLVGNALKFTPSGGRVWVEAEAGAEDVQVAVVDTGPGIPVEERARIFEKFTQVRGQDVPRKGSGLGLTFCRMAIEAHGGRVWVEDGPEGEGSRFAFTIPQASEG